MLNDLASSEIFSERLYEKMKYIDPCVQDLELYEFRYALDNIYPQNGWASVQLDSMCDIEERIQNCEFYTSIQIKNRVNGRIVMDETVIQMTQMLLVGLVTGEYPEAWIKRYFYFDIRGFYFLARVNYFTPAVLAHLGGKPFKQFEQRQKRFERFQSIGYKDFRAANAEIDALFIESAIKLTAANGTPVLLAIAGATAAGKTEIVMQLREAFTAIGKSVTSIELDNFFTDRDYREAQGIDSLGKEAYHFEIFKQSLEDIVAGKKIIIPHYDTINATSSHDLDGNLKPERNPIEIEPADIIFIEGNFPFLIPEVAHLIGIKVVYLTDDPIRLKRKWRRDIDFRRKYDVNYFCNRYFKDQFLMAQECFLPQLEMCDLVVDTTGAALWATPEIAKILECAE